jgi:outer membrane protein
MNGFIKNALLCALLAVLSALAVSYAFVGFYGDERLAYVENRELFDSFKGSKELGARLEALKKRHSEILDSMGLALKSSIPLGNGEKKAEWERSYGLFEKLRGEFAAEQQEKNARYTQSSWAQINAYMKEFGEARGYSLIFGADGSGNLIYAKNGLDVTKEAIDYINKRYEGN